MAIKFLLAAFLPALLVAACGDTRPIIPNHGLGGAGGAGGGVAGGTGAGTGGAPGGDAGTEAG
jgi:hypothetical protein